MKEGHQHPSAYGGDLWSPPSFPPGHLPPCMDSNPVRILLDFSSHGGDTPCIVPTTWADGCENCWESARAVRAVVRCLWCVGVIGAASASSAEHCWPAEQDSGKIATLHIIPQLSGARSPITDHSNRRSHHRLGEFRWDADGLLLASLRRVKLPRPKGRPPGRLEKCSYDTSPAGSTASASAGQGPCSGVCWPPLDRWVGDDGHSQPVLSIPLISWAQTVDLQAAMIPISATA